MSPQGPITLCIDIGGTGIKGMLVGATGHPASKPVVIATPRPATVTAVISVIQAIGAELAVFDRVSVGFPGTITDGAAVNANNLGTHIWSGIDVRRKIGEVLARPVRVLNDADVQGFGLIKGSGVELVLTLGTGVGSSLFVSGVLVPNLELGDLRLARRSSVETRLGKAALQRIGVVEWRRRVTETIDLLRPVFNWRLLHLGGGHAAHFKPGVLPRDVAIGSNAAGLLGGIALWRH